MVGNGVGRWLCGRKHRARRRIVNDEPRQKELMSERVRKFRAREKRQRYDEIMEALADGTYDT